MNQIFVLLSAVFAFSAHAELNGTFQIRECSQLLMPVQPSDTEVTVTFSSGAFDLQIRNLGWLGGDCTAEASGTYTEQGGAVQLQITRPRFQGSFTSPCQDLVESLSEVPRSCLELKRQ